MLKRFVWSSFRCFKESFIHSFIKWILTQWGGGEYFCKGVQIRSDNRLVNRLGLGIKNAFYSCSRVLVVSLSKWWPSFYLWLSADSWTERMKQKTEWKTGFGEKHKEAHWWGETTLLNTRCQRVQLDLRGIQATQSLRASTVVQKTNQRSLQL